mgnify:CR=1 FL=1
MDRVPAWMEQWNMWPERGGTILCAVSGGKDSMAMLCCLRKLGQSHGVQIVAAHYHHGIRGETADRDAAFVEDFCRQQEIPCEVGRGDVPTFAAQEGLSMEEAGRKLRYAFLEQAADTLGADKIATAHHAGDNAETVLFQLLRGSGSKGLSGIAPVRGRLIRPLLCVESCEIRAYIEKNGIPYMEDESNADLNISRNFIRQEVMPLLRQVNAGAERHINQAALCLGQEDAFLEEQAAAWLQGMKRQKAEVALPLRQWSEAPAALHSRMLRRMLLELGAPCRDVTQEHLQVLERLKVSGSMDFPSGVQAEKKETWLLLRMRAAIPSAETLEEEQWVAWGPWKVFLTKKEEKIVEGRFTIPLSCDKITKPLQLAAWKGSDYMCLPEGRGKQSVKRLLMDVGYDVQQRAQMPLLRMGEEIVALCGVGAAKDFLPRTGENRCYVLFQKKDKGERA